MALQAVVFDFGGVLFDWNPDYLYRELIPDAQEREWFLREVCSPQWNLQQDGGRSFAEAIAEASARYPAYATQIDAFFSQWPKTLRGTLDDGVALLDELTELGVALYGLTNWSAETYPYALANYPLLKRFRHVVVSGELKMIKPDPAIYQHTLAQIRQHQPQIAAHEIAFIDDNAVNSAAASTQGWHGIHHHAIAHTRAQLRELGLALR